MLISLVGNETNTDSYGIPFNTEYEWHKTLEKLNHTVRFIQENTILGGTLPSLVEGSDLFIWVRTWPDVVTMDDLKKIEAMGIPTVSLHLDKYSDIIRDGGMGIGSPFWHTQHVFSPEGSIQAARIFKEHGIRQHYLPPAIFEDSCYIAEPVEEFKHDVVFVGGGSSYGHEEWRFYRHDLMMFLHKTYGDKFGKYGGAERTVRGHELNQLYSSSKIAISDSLNKDFIDSHYFSDRNFLCTGRGICTISPYIPGITDFFVDRKEIILYAFGNWVQLKNLIDYYLEHDDERQAIAQAGFERTKRDHTFTNRMTKMLQILKDEGAIK